MRRRRHSFRRYGFWCFRGPFGFSFMGGMPGDWFFTGRWPDLDEEIRMLEEYRDELKAELEEVEKRIERLKRES